jgi:hypothetical protein
MAPDIVKLVFDHRSGQQRMRARVWFEAMHLSLRPNQLRRYQREIADIGPDIDEYVTGAEQSPQQLIDFGLVSVSPPDGSTNRGS